MDLMTFRKTDKAVHTTFLVTLAVALIEALAFGMCFVYLSNKIDGAYRQALVIDTSGQVFRPTTVNESAMRVYEYENHVKTFVSMWYSFDETNYESRVKTGLQLIGNRGKELLSEYRDVEMYNSLIQKNIRYDILVRDIHINMNTVPVSGEIEFTQMGFRAKGSSAREVYVMFTLYDVDRSRENPHGVKIEDWKVRYSETRETTKKEEKTNKTHKDEL